MNQRDDPDTPAHAALSAQDATGEYLAGILALARLSRVTVACKSSPYPGGNLLALARLTAIPGETALLFDDWEDASRPDLAAAMREALRPAGEALAPPARSSHPVLAILDGFERHLELPADDARAQADGRALCEFAADPHADIHFLLLVAESAAPLLQRYAAQIPGIAEASLRLPPPAASGAQAANADASADANARPRKRSFGSLLERLNDRAAEAPAAISAERAIEERAAQQADMPPLLQAAEDRGAGNFWNEEPPAAPYAESIAPPVAETCGEREQTPPLEDGAPAAATTAETHADSSPATAPMVARVDADADAKADGELDAPHDLPPQQPAPAPFEAIDTDKTMPWQTAEPPVEHVALPGTGRVPVRAALPSAAAPAAAHTAPAAPKRAVRAGYVAVAGIAAAAIAWMLLTRAPHDAATPAQTAQPPQAQAETPRQVQVGMAAGDAAAASVPAAAPSAAGEMAQPPVAPAAAAAAKSGKTSLYIVVGNSRERDRVRPIAQNLARQGIDIVAVSQTDRGPSVSDLRYFFPAERDDALKMRQALQEAGIAVRKVNLVPGYESRATHRRFELWLADDGALAAPENAAGLAHSR